MLKFFSGSLSLKFIKKKKRFSSRQNQIICFKSLGTLSAFGNFNKFNERKWGKKEKVKSAAAFSVLLNFLLISHKINFDSKEMNEIFIEASVNNEERKMSGKNGRINESTIVNFAYKVFFLASESISTLLMRNQFSGIVAFSDNIYVCGDFWIIDC